MVCLNINRTVGLYRQTNGTQSAIGVTVNINKRTANIISVLCFQKENI